MSQYFLHISWFQILVAIALIVLCYMIMNLVLNSPWIRLNLKSNNVFSRFLKHLYWPLAGVIIAGFFIIKHPIAHGFMVLITTLLSWRYIREIFLGAFLKFSQVFHKNTPYHINGMQGTLISLDRIGGQFKFHQGTQFFTYSQLLDSQAIALVNDVASDELAFRCTNDGCEQFTVAHIQDMIFQCPYVDHYFKPKINVVDGDTISVKINTRSQISSEIILNYFKEKEPLINFRISNNTF
jgi:hypothetical protein